MKHKESESKIINYLIRFIVLFVLLIQVFLFFKYYFNMFDHVGVLDLALGLANWEVTLALMLLNIIIFSVAAFFGKPKDDRIPMKYDIALFPAIVIILSLAFVSLHIYVIKYMLFNIWSDSAPENPQFSYFIIYKKYLILLLIQSISIALSVADARIYRKNVFHWWLIPFLPLPFPYISHLFPILWWNFLHSWVPWRPWKYFRIPLLFLSCTIPVTSFVLFPPTAPIEGWPHPNQKLEQHFRGDNCFVSYFAEWNQDLDEYIVVCSRNLHKVVYDKEKGYWTAVNNIFVNAVYDIAAFDPYRNLAYIHDGEKDILYTLVLKEFKLLSKRKFKILDVRINSLGHLSYYDKKGGFLYLYNFEVLTKVEPGLDYGSAVSIALSGDLMSMTLDESTNTLLVLTDKIYLLDANTLEIKNSLIPPSIALDFENDNLNNCYYISFPKLMETWVLNKTDLRVVAKIDAPIGVRTLEVDEENKILFQSAMTGVIEQRSLDDYHLISRFRVAHWIHYLHGSPKKRKLVVSPNARPFVISYDARPVDDDYSGALLKILEDTARKIMKNFPAGSLQNINEESHVPQNIQFRTEPED